MAQRSEFREKTFNWDIMSELQEKYRILSLSCNYFSELRVYTVSCNSEFVSHISELWGGKKSGN